jgi:hypothetical protein
MPCGFTREGLPVGLQIVGRRFDDLGVLQMSAAFEAARPWAAKRPPLDSGAAPTGGNADQSGQVIPGDGPER